MKKNVQTIIIIVLLTSCLFFLLKESQEVMESVSFSISIWKDNLFPSLFPFLVLSYFLMNYGISDLVSYCLTPFVTKVLNLPSSCGFTIIASILSGFPSNAKFIKDQLDQKEITKQEAEYLISFCFSSSPLFIIGTVGILLLGSKTMGIFILLAQYIGNLCLALFLRPKQLKMQKTKKRPCFSQTKEKILHSKPFANVLRESIQNALEILFLLLGIVTVFLIITNIILTIIPLTLEQKTFLSGVLEMTQGVKNASLLNSSLFQKSYFMLWITSLGGLSVHTQILSILEGYKISYWKFLRNRIFATVFSTILLTIFIALL